MRKIKLLNTKNEPKCRLQKVANFQTSAAPISGYFASYEENVLPAAREAILKEASFMTCSQLVTDLIESK